MELWNLPRIIILGILIVEVRGLSNVALRKPVEMSSIYTKCAGCTGNWTVDGVKTGNPGHGCSVTDKEAKPWMIIDLGEECLISSIFIQNLVENNGDWSKWVSGDNSTLPWYFKTMRIVLEIGYDLNNFTEVWSFNGAVGLNFQAEITFPVNGRFVKFWLDATEYLSACEIEVYGEDVPVDGVINVAFGKSVELSSVAGQATGGYYAVDGVKTGLTRDGCAATSYEAYPWITIDLGEEFLISSIYVQNLVLAPEYLTQVWGTGHAPWYWNSTVRFVIDIRSSSTSYSTAVDHKGFFQNNKTFTLEPPQCGRYVKVWLEAETSLSVCEIEMYSMTETFSGTSNVAFGKSVQLSSTFGQATGGYHVVDGVKSGLTKDGCAITNYDDNPWLIIDLGEEYLIPSLFIQNIVYDSWSLWFLENKQMLPWYHKTSRLRFELGNSSDNYSEVWSREDVFGNNFTIELEPPQSGRFFKISIQAVESLSICELEVHSMGAIFSQWSEWSPCSKSCGNGTATRSRACKAVECCGSVEESAHCNTHECPFVESYETCSVISEPRDCQDIKEGGENTSGVYHVTPVGSFTGYDVYCDMETQNGGWLVFQRRVSDAVDFNRTWFDYTSGFGNLTGNMWLGLRKIYQITSQGHYELWINLQDWEGGKTYASYKVFKLGNSKSQYELIVDDYYGDAGDSLSQHDGQPFTTADGDSTVNSCVSRLGSGWWYKDCLEANLNGQYLNGTYDTSEGARGIAWSSWKSSNYSLRRTEMKIRRV